MSQPEWELIDEWDDTRIYRDKTGAYVEEAEIDEVDEEAKIRRVYRFCLDRMKWVTDPNPDEGEEPKRYLVPFGYEPSWPGDASPSRYVEWFDKDLDAVARSAGRENADEIREALTSDDWRARLGAYLDIAGYWGIDNFDNYPRVVKLCAEDFCFDDCVQQAGAEDSIYCDCHIPECDECQTRFGVTRDDDGRVYCPVHKPVE